MTSPWLTIPLADYEGHMASRRVGQAQMLAAEFAALLATHRPRSAAVVGCAGGNGFDDAARAGVTRLVGIDLNARYLDHARERHAHAFASLELHAVDIARALPPIPAVELVYAALVFEYVDVVDALTNIRALCAPAAVFAALLQLPKADASAVTASTFRSLERLGDVMELVPPMSFRDAAVARGFRFRSERRIALESGKSFALLQFDAPAFDRVSPLVGTPTPR